MSPLVEKLAEQLHRLEQQVQAHDARLSDKDKKWLTEHSAFHDQLFEHQGASFNGYLHILRQDLKHIAQLEQLNGRPDNLALICQRFANRFAALSQAMANSSVIHNGLQISAQATAKRFNNMRAKKQQAAQKQASLQAENEFFWIAQSVLSSSHALYNELRKHHGWVANFEDRIRELERDLNLQQGQEKIKLRDEILETHKRLGRCRRAISYIEERIDFLEKPNRGNY